MVVTAFLLAWLATFLALLATFLAWLTLGVSLAPPRRPHEPAPLAATPP